MFCVYTEVTVFRSYADLNTQGRMQKGRLTNPQISLVLGLVSPGIKVGMLKAVLSVDLLILVLKSGRRLCLHKM